jgi:hypothetical protein
VNSRPLQHNDFESGWHCLLTKHRLAFCAGVLSAGGSQLLDQNALISDETGFWLDEDQKLAQQHCLTLSVL